MDKKNKDILKKGLHETKMDFTSSVMGKIHAEEKALSSLISREGAMETSDSFTMELMSKLEGKVPAKSYTPVISKSAWIGIAAIFTGVILMAFLASGSGTGSLKYDLRVERLANGISSIFQYSQAITYSCFGVLILTLALLYEQRSRKIT